jgi:hypothetical protein
MLNLVLKEILRLDAGTLDEVEKLGGVDKPLPPEVSPNQSGSEENEREKIKKTDDRENIKSKGVSK